MYTNKLIVLFSTIFFKPIVDQLVHRQIETKLGELYCCFI